MPSSHHLQPAPSSIADAALSPEQSRFNTLIAEIGRARATLVAWQTQVPLCHQAHVKRIEPLIRQWRQARRESVLTLDALFHDPGWTSAEVATLRELIRRRLGDWMASDAPPDPALKALFDKHREAEVDGDRPASRRKSSAQAEAGTPGEPGPLDDIDDDPEFTARLRAEAVREAAKAGAKAARVNAKAKAKASGSKSAVQTRRENEARQAAQSTREVYRQLASALHPDREPDAAQRDRKTVLMQRVNTAYAANDLLALLELRLETLQIDLSPIEGANAQRLKHYNQALAEQLRDMKLEIERVQRQFELDFGIDAARPLNPMKLGRLIDEGYRDISAMLLHCKQEAQTLTDRAATKHWLKRVRVELREPAMDDDLL